MNKVIQRIIDTLAERGDILEGERLFLVQDAYKFATKAHEGMVRKGTALPYIVHPIETAEIAAQLTSDAHIIAAAFLHDVIEDCGVHKETLSLIFGRRVGELVASASENKRHYLSKEETWKIRKEETLHRLKNASHDEKIIALCDKISNIRSTRNDYLKMGDEVWTRFNQKDKKMHAWYYWNIAELLKADFEDTPQWQEFRDMCMEIFGAPEEM